MASCLQMSPEVLRCVRMVITDLTREGPLVVLLLVTSVHEVSLSPLDAVAGSSYRRLVSDPKSLLHDGTGHLKTEAGSRGANLGFQCCVVIGCKCSSWTLIGETTGCLSTSGVRVRSIGISYWLVVPRGKETQGELFSLGSSGVCSSILDSVVDERRGHCETKSQSHSMLASKESSSPCWGCSIPNLDESCCSF